MKKLNELKNYRKIDARFVHPNNTRGARICIEEKKRYNDCTVKRKYFSCGDKPLQEQAFDILTKNGFNVICLTSNAESYGFLCDNWAENYIEISDIKA